MNVLGKLSQAAAKVAPSSEDVKDAAEGVANVAAAAAVGVASKSKDAASKLKEYGEEKVGSSKAKLRNLIEELKAKVELLVKTKIYELVEQKIVNRMPAMAKDMLEDYEAPKCINRGKDKAVDAVWPEIKDEIMWEVAVMLHAKPEDEEEALAESRACCCCAFFRYHFYPFDKGFWGKLRDPVFVFVKILSLIPFWGVMPVLYLFNFIIIDKRDTYQLIQYILNFKGSQFVTLGVIRCMQGYVSFFLCVTARGRHDEHSCEDGGPGTSGEFLATSAGFLCQILFTWVAFMRLSCSKDMTRRTLKEDLGERKTQHANRRGGALFWFLLYDLFCFLLCGGGLAVVMTRVEEYDGWVVQHSVFALQVLYGLTSLPFFVFTIPGIQLILTHSVPSAYDRNGRVVKPSRAAARDRAREAAEAKAKADDSSVVSDKDMNGVMKALKKALPSSISASLFSDSENEEEEEEEKK
eukprot:TRINITY_DN1207_c1_g1_i1.p1 TRINITY_DN1207_c1_g1~~TRINITY_DN1207_c1_g1_i1.p1  ORF type:complete len:466 (+),score=114.94 TRINITY_DN1207_c1_g1_i1:130-1527(+)